MNFQVLKNDFRDYLEGQQALNRETDELDYEDASIFMHAGEFRKFLAQEYGADTATCYKNVSEILKLEVVDGKLVDPEAPKAKENGDIMQAIEDVKQEQELEADALEEQETDTPIEEASVAKDTEDDTTDLGVDSIGVQGEQTQPTGELDPDMQLISDTTNQYALENGVNIQDSELVVGILNDLLGDKDFKEAIDKDGDGIIGKEDLSAFYNVVKDYDDDPDTISLEDILSAVEDICEGTFKYATDEEYQEQIGETPSKVDTGSSAQSYTSPAASGAYGSYASTGSNSVGSRKEIEKYDENGKAIIQNMTVEELQAELVKANDTLSQKQQAYEQIMSGEDEELKSLEEQMEGAYDDFEKELSEKNSKLAKDITTQKGLISDKKEEISNKEVEIAEAETKLSEAEAQYTNAVSRRQALESQLAILNEQSSKPNAPKDIGQKIEAINAEIAKAKKDEEELKDAKERARDAIKLKEGEKQDLDSALSSLNDDMASLEAQVPPDVQEKFMKPYKELQKQYESTKEQKAAAAKKEVEEAQNYVNELQTGISAKQTNDDINKNYSVNDGQAVLEQAYKYLGMSEGQFESASGQGVPDGLWCAAFVHEILKEVRGTENLPSWYENCNYNGCGSVLNAARQNNAAFTDAAEAQPGDLVIFRTNRSDTGHIGFVVKVENGIVYTIEGNTSSQVGERQYEVGSSRINSFVRLPQ